jgi:hypothetical protein
VIGRVAGKLYLDGSWHFNITDDYNVGSDDWAGGPRWEVSMQDIVGRVLGRVPLLGYALLFIQWIFLDSNWNADNTDIDTYFFALHASLFTEEES